MLHENTTTQTESVKETLPTRTETTDQTSRAVEMLLSALSVLAENKDLPNLARRHIYEGVSKTAAVATDLILKRDLQKNLPATIELERNPAKRPILESIKETVETFRQRHPEEEVTYSLNPWYTGLDSFLQNYRAIVTSFSQPSDLEHDEHTVFLSTGEHTYLNLIRVSEGDLARVVGRPLGLTIIDLFRKGELSPIEVAEAVMNLLPHKAAAKEVLAAKSSNSLTGTQIQVKWPQVQEIIRRLETNAIENNNPATTATLLFFCLESTHGKLNEALNLQATILKYKARESYDIRVATTQEEEAAWMKENILDEFSPYIPYNYLQGSEGKDNPYTGRMAKLWQEATFVYPHSADPTPKTYFDLDLNNRVGLPYHAYHMVYLLSSFPPEIIFTLMLGEYIQFGNEHGLIKFLADLRVASDLYKVKDYLESFVNKRK